MIFLYKNVDEGLEICAINPIKEGSKDAYISAVQSVHSTGLNLNPHKEAEKKRIIKISTLYSTRK